MAGVSVSHTDVLRSNLLILVLLIPDLIFIIQGVIVTFGIGSITVKLLMNALFLVLSMLPIASVAATYTLKLGHVANDAHPWNKAFLYLAATVDRKSGGRLHIDVYPNSQLGSERDMITAIQLGRLDMTMSGELLQNWAPKAALLAIPYAIKNSAHMAKLVNGPIGQLIEQEIIERTHLIPVAWFERAPRNLTSNKPIRQPMDLNGMTIRVPNVPIFVFVWSALGANPIPMAFNQVFSALKEGAIDGQENPLDLIQSASFFQVQKYVNKTEHVRSWIYVLIGKRQFDALPEDLQNILLESAKEMQVYEHQLAVETQKKLVQQLQAEGMQFIDVNKEKFRMIAVPAVKKSLRGDVLDLFEQIQTF